MSLSLLGVEDCGKLYLYDSNRNNSIIVNKDAYTNNLPESLDISRIDSLPELLLRISRGTVFYWIIDLIDCWLTKSSGP